ncbi:hypothetical protein HYPGJ_31596 [Hyphomicrobium sp. GJ21]|nr:hypothetical protein [Hyphomicrobium sp. GJ21]CEJ88103.1 hypothetical protein HYPGJ_31596 [Hyphomicrobium sp. GJ21]
MAKKDKTLETLQAMKKMQERIAKAHQKNERKRGKEKDRER